MSRDKPHVHLTYHGTLISGHFVGYGLFAINVSGRSGCPIPYGPKFSQFHAVFYKNFGKNYMLAPPPTEILDPPLNVF